MFTLLCFGRPNVSNEKCSPESSSDLSNAISAKDAEVISQVPCDLAYIFAHQPGPSSSMFPCFRLLLSLDCTSLNRSATPIRYYKSQGSERPLYR